MGQAVHAAGDVPLKDGVDDKTPVPKQVLALSPEDFFNRLNRLLVTNPPEPDDPKTMARLATLGIAPGATFRMDAFTPEVRKAIEAGVADGIKVMRETVRGKVVNGWQIALDMGRYGTRYTYRAGWTFFGVGGNLPEDAVYPFAEIDGDGKPFNGANKYSLHFTKAEIPPVDAFWSLTMYDDDAYLVANPINRYALGDRSHLTFDAEGGLTLYVQSDSPGKDKESNWLPAPKDAGFKLALRLYAPKKEVADGDLGAATCEARELTIRRTVSAHHHSCWPAAGAGSARTCTPQSHMLQRFGALAEQHAPHCDAGLPGDMVRRF